MDIQATKIDLIHWLTELDDQNILARIKLFKDRQEEELSEAHKKLLDDRLFDFENNPDKVLDWESVMIEIEKDL
ncbi:MAG: addiction module protein [Cyclobacteriaceae bacterium]